MAFDPEAFKALNGRGLPTPGQPQQIGPFLLVNPQTQEKWLAPSVATVAFSDDAINALMRGISMRDDLTKTFVAATVVQQRNMRHKKRGGRAGDWSILEVMQHLINEVGELGEAITDEVGTKPAGKSSQRAKVLSEVADVQCVLYAIMVKYGFTLQEVNIEGLRKLEERFTDEPSEEEMLVKGEKEDPSGG